MHRKVVAPGSLLHHKVLHQRTFTTEALLRRNVLHKKPTFHQFFFYTRNVLTPSIPLHQKQKPLTPKSTRRALQTTKLFLHHNPLYSKELLHQKLFKPRAFYTSRFLRRKHFYTKNKSFDTRNLLHQQTYAPQALNARNALLHRPFTPPFYTTSLFQEQVLTPETHLHHEYFYPEAKAHQSPPDNTRVHSTLLPMLSNAL